MSLNLVGRLEIMSSTTQNRRSSFTSSTASSLAKAKRLPSSVSLWSSSGKAKRVTTQNVAVKRAPLANLTNQRNASSSSSSSLVIIVSLFNSVNFSAKEKKSHWNFGKIIEFVFLTFHVYQNHYIMMHYEMNDWLYLLSVLEKQKESVLLC